MRLTESIRSLNLMFLYGIAVYFWGTAFLNQLKEEISYGR